MIDPSRVRISGALEPFAADFAAELARQGYRSGSQTQQLRLMAHVSRWLGSNDLDVADFPCHAERFLQARPTGCWLQVPLNKPRVASVADVPAGSRRDASRAAHLHRTCGRGEVVNLPSLVDPAGRAGLDRRRLAERVAPVWAAPVDPSTKAPRTALRC